jgi:predicted RND superfamily exporter protein
MPRSFSERIAAWLLAGRWPLLLLAVLVAAACIVPARNVKFDRSIENMFAPDDPLLPPYLQLKSVFGGNEVVLAVYSDPRLLDEDRGGIERLTEISRQLKDTPGVRDVLSLAEVDRVLDKVAMAAGLMRSSDVPENGIVDAKSALSRRFLRLFEGYTHGSDGRTAAVICMLEPQESPGATREETVSQLREKIQRLAGGTVAGEPVMVVDGFRYVEEDGRRLGWASTILLSLVLLICFRRLRWMVLCVAVVQLALLATRSALVVSGLRLSMVSSMLTAIVTVVGVATVMHLIVRFREGRRAGLVPHASFLLTASLLAIPVFWAIMTDAVGFSSLLVARVGPVRDFGLMMAVGSLFVLVSVVLIAPGLTLIGPQPPIVHQAWIDRLVSRRLTRSATWLQRRPKTILLVVLTASIAGAAGAYRLELETDFTKNFRAGSRIVRAYEIIETDLGGAGIWDLYLPAPSALDFGYLRQVRELEQRIAKELTDPAQGGAPAVRTVSIADAVWAGTPNLERKRMLTRTATVSASVAAMRAHMPTFTAALHAEDPQAPGKYYYRIMLRSAERQSAAQKKHLIETVARLAREEFPEAEVTGFFVLLTNLIQSILRDQWLAFLVATGGIALCMLAAFRRLRYAAIAMVPNVLPIMTVTGVMGWLGFKINMGAAMIAAVSMGLSVDSSIHYIQAFLRARRSGKSVAEAIADVQQTVGYAMILSTFALVAGFAVLATSEFVPTIYFGVLVSLAMLGGLAGNLVILPLLLWLVSWRERRAESA